MEYTSVIYCRVSSDEQVDGTSLNHQERVCRECSSRKNAVVLEAFIEPGESAKTTNRPQLQRALAFCKAKRVDFFIFYKIDRFARVDDDYRELRKQLAKYGTRLVSATEQFDPTPAGKLTENMLASIAEFDNDVRSERTRAGMMARVDQGVWVWKEPIGYCRTRGGENIVPDPERARFIQMAFEEDSKGIYTYDALARYLTDRGFRTRTGLPPSFQLLAKILHNPIYCGIMKINGKQYPGSFPPLVSEDLFAQCQDVHSRGILHTMPRAGNNPLFPLRNVVSCAGCGDLLTGSSCRGKLGTHYPYYHHHSQGCPQARFIPKDELERRLKEYLRDFAAKPEFEAAFRKTMLDLCEEQLGKQGTIKAVTAREIAALEGERQQIFALHRKGVYTDEDFLDQKLSIEVQINEKRRLSLETALSRAQLQRLMDLFFEVMRHPDFIWTWSGRNYAYRLRLQKLIFRSAIPFDGKSFSGTPDLALIYKLNQGFDRQISDMVAYLRSQWNPILEELQSWDDWLSEWQATIGA